MKGFPKMGQATITDVQDKILDIMRFIDQVCREHEIVYYIMGGTALGAVRHGGFIPWDDDLDIFMTPDNYGKFRSVFRMIGSGWFVLQEWKITGDYLEYAKVRMNGTTFIEAVYQGRKEMHHGIYVDIMILHKCPANRLIQRLLFYASKYVTLAALSQRNWKPKTQLQKLALGMLNILPNQSLSRHCYQLIYQYEGLERNFVYCYFITKARFYQGIFARDLFAAPVDVPFAGTVLMGPTDIRKYLEIRYGDYLRLPPEEQRREATHAQICDTEIGFEEYLH
jgi:lipopolysaccharide cholinephosphotransferase